MEDQKLNFTYPEGFTEAANRLQFLPDEESRKKFLDTLITIMLKI